jgi:3-dehydroquinate synthetase
MVAITQCANYEFVVHTKPGTNSFAAYSYPLYVRDQPDWGELAAILTGMNPDHITLVADQALSHPFVGLVSHNINTLTGTPVHLVWQNANEQEKTLKATLDTAYRDRLSGGGTHASIVIALGGGLVGNVAGLASALVVRGIKLVHIPTTLLAGTDSVLSCKQGVNGELPNGFLVKNLLGVFKAPDSVMIWLNLWKTLPADEIRAGMCELIKNVVAIHPHLYEEVYSFLNPEANYTLDDYHRVFRWCYEAKQAVMREDAHEQGTALILEYGHTFGHALESLIGIKHGLAVGLGMRVAAQIAVTRGYCYIEEADKITRLLERNGSLTYIPRGVSLDDIMTCIAQDNKIGYLPRVEGHHTMVLLAHLGEPVTRNGLPLTYVKDGELRAAIATILEPKADTSAGLVAKATSEKEGKSASL